MKGNKVVVLGIVCLVLLVSLLPLSAACSKPAPDSGSGAEQPQKVLHFAGGTGAGMAGILATATAQILTKHARLEVAVETATGLEVYPLIRSGDIDIQFISASTPLLAYQGRGNIEKTRLRDLLSAVPPTAASLVIMTRMDTGIKAIKDLRGKTVNAESPRQPMYGLIMEALLKTNNMTKGDVKWIRFAQADESARDIQEKRIDVGVMFLGARVVEVDKAVGAYIIPLTPQEQAAGAAADPSFMAYTLPKGFFELRADTPSLVSPFHYIARPDLSDITAYTVVKTLFSNIDEFHKVHEQNSGVTVKSALSHMVLPIHPGAIRYYKEVGVWTKDHDAKQQELLTREKALFGDK